MSLRHSDEIPRVIRGHFGHPLGNVPSSTLSGSSLLTFTPAGSLSSDSSLVHGQPFTVTGSGFGTSTGTVIYDDFTLGTLNAAIADDAAAVIGAYGFNEHGRPKYSNAKTRGVHNRVAFHDFPNDAVSGSVALSLDDTVVNGEVGYTDWWHWIPTGAEDLTDNYKVLRYYGNPYPSVECNWVYGFTTDSYINNVPVDDGLADQQDSSPNVFMRDNANTWRHYRHMISLSSSLGSDHMIGRIDNTTCNDHTGGQRSFNTHTLETLRVGYYNQDTQFDVYTSCFHWQLGTKRVEVSNNSNYNAAGAIVEIQPVEAADWSDTTINIPKFNKGMLSSGTNYVHVSLAFGFGTPHLTYAVEVA